MIQLYAWDTPNGRKISVALEEMGLTYRVEPVDITQGRQFAPDFLRLSPNNRIPAIVDAEGPDGAPISVFESGAILVYLAEKTGLFLPASGRGRVQVMEWLMWQMGGFGPMPGQVHHFLGVDEKDRAYGLERYQKETRRLYGVLDRRLGEGGSSPAPSRSPISPSWPGPGATPGTGSISPITRTCGAGTRRWARRAHLMTVYSDRAFSDEVDAGSSQKMRQNERPREATRSCRSLASRVFFPSHPQPHPEVSVHRRWTDLEGGLQKPQRSLEPSFEAASQHLRMRSRVGHV